MIDRRKLVELGLFGGMGLAAPGVVLAKPHQRAEHPLGRHHGLGRHAGTLRGADHRREERLIATQQTLPPADPAMPRRLSIYNVHTDEKVDAVYWEHGAYVTDALDAVNQVLRDFRTGEVRAIEPRLLDVLVDLHASAAATSPFQVISGYRSPQTNQMLREQSAEVAQRSFHIDGKAIDLYLDDIALPQLRAAAMDMSRGGVGYYPHSNFIHVDVGPVRHWQGA